MLLLDIYQRLEKIDSKIDYCIQPSGQMHGWTKAIYDGENLQDFMLLCKGDELVNMTPIGKEIYVGRNWTYPSYDVNVNVWC